MTISAITRLAGPYLGDGSTATFPFGFKVFDRTDLSVGTINTSTGALAQLVLDSDFSAALNPDQDASPGGSITLLAGNLAAGLQLSITTAMAEVQDVNLINGGGFFPDVINVALDILTILIQQLQVQANRTLQVPFGDTTNMQLPAPILRAGKVLMFDSSGNLQLVPVAGGGILPGVQLSPSTVDGNNKDFNFTAPAGSTPAILVFAGGVFQNSAGGAPDYSAPVYVSGTTWKITFTTAPANGPVVILML